MYHYKNGAKQNMKLGLLSNHKKIILYFSTLILSIVPAFFYTAPAFEDGLGTMATAAYLAGHDWSAFLGEDGYYYKYGQSLWYIVPFMFINNAVIRYRLMLVINSVLTAFIPVIAYRIAADYKLAERRDAFAISLLTGMLPATLLYNKYTWAEANLFIIPWLIVFLQTKLYMEGGTFSYRKKMIYSAGIALLSVYAFMSHQRGLIILIAATVMVFWIRHCKKDSILLWMYLLVLVSGLVLDRVISVWQKANVYAGAVLRHNTLADFLKPEIYQKMFSAKGVEALFLPFVGWLYNCACSTFGIALVGLCFMSARCWKWIRKKGSRSALDVIAGEGILCFLGAFALGLLFFFQSSYGYFEGTDVQRCDHLFFGRYLESSIPILFYFGLIGLCNVQDTRRVMNLTFMLQSGMFIFTTLRLLPRMNNVNCYVHSLMSMNLFMDTTNITKTLDIVSNYVPALFLFGVVSIIISLLFRLFYSKNRRAAYTIIGCLFLWIYIWNSITVTGRIDSACATKYAQYYLSH